MKETGSRPSVPRASYSSPLRARQKEGTSQLILNTVAETIRHNPDLASVTIAEIARRAAITERTVYRHFSSRDALLKSFWRWRLQGAAGTDVTNPRTLSGLLETVRRLFTNLDADETVFRAMLFSAEGRDIRRQLNEARYANMLNFVEPLLPGMPESERQAVAAGIVVMCSVMSWMFMRDNCGLDGARAGDAATTVIRLLIEGSRNADAQRAAGE